MRRNNDEFREFDAIVAMTVAVLEWLITRTREIGHATSLGQNLM